MGYSIAVICRSKESQKKMLRFLKKYFKHFIDDPFKRYISDPSSNLSYSDSKTQVGFDYKSHWGADGYERAYYYSILHWIALKVGKKAAKIGKYSISKPSPYIRYDGFENWPVLIDKPRSKILYQFWVDELGILRDVDNLFHPWLIELFLECVFPLQTGKLHPDADRILGRKIITGEIAPLNFDQANITPDERITLVTTICKSQIDAAINHIRTEIQKLNDEWERLE